MLHGIENFTLSDEMQKRIEALHNASKSVKRIFTNEEDYIILNYYEVKNKEELAKLLNCNKTTLLKRYRELKNGYK